jgi:5'-methylthioadenosine phosphorylase
MAKAKLGIIGGSGLYDLPGLSNIHELQISTLGETPQIPFASGRSAEAKSFSCPGTGAGTDCHHQA